MYSICWLRNKDIENCIFTIFAYNLYFDYKVLCASSLSCPLEPLTLLSPDLNMNMLKETYTLVLKTLTSGVPEDDPIPPHPAHSAVAAAP